MCSTRWQWWQGLTNREWLINREWSGALVLKCSNCHHPLMHCSFFFRLLFPKHVLYMYALLIDLPLIFRLSRPFFLQCLPFCSLIFPTFSLFFFSFWAALFFPLHLFYFLLSCFSFLSFFVFFAYISYSFSFSIFSFFSPFYLFPPRAIFRVWFIFLLYDSGYPSRLTTLFETCLVMAFYSSCTPSITANPKRFSADVARLSVF